MIQKLLTVITVSLSLNVTAQTVSNGSFTGLQPGTNTFNVTDWSKLCSNGASPDVCDITSPTFMWGPTTVTASDSPDGGTWLGLASQDECVEGSITGLIPGVDYTLCFYGANFGSGNGSGLWDGYTARPVITIGGTSEVFSIPMAASTWDVYSMVFTANNTSMILNVSSPDITSGNYSDPAAYYVCLDGFTINGCNNASLLDGQNNSPQFNVVPNPTSGNLSVDLGASYEKVHIIITDISGKVIQSQNAAQSHTLNLSIENNPAGIYFISIQAGHKTEVIRLVKE